MPTAIKQEKEEEYGKPALMQTRVGRFYNPLPLKAYWFGMTLMGQIFHVNT